MTKPTILPRYTHEQSLNDKLCICRKTETADRTALMSWLTWVFAEQTSHWCLKASVKKLYKCKQSGRVIRKLAFAQDKRLYLLLSCLFSFHIHRNVTPLVIFCGCPVLLVSDLVWNSEVPARCRGVTFILSANLPTYLPIYLSIYLIIYLSIYLSIYPILTTDFSHTHKY